MKPIQMVDLTAQIEDIKPQILEKISEILSSSHYIKGNYVSEFQDQLSQYIQSKYVLGCANGTDALQVALMALNLKPGDKVLVPSWTYVASAEVIALLQLKPVFIDVCMKSFNLDVSQLDLISEIHRDIKAAIPVHLYGQSADMEPILAWAKEHHVAIIEDNAQAIGAKYRFSNGSEKFCGTIGDLGTTSFFPSKNLGTYGDGGAIFCNKADLFQQISGICDHGQLSQKYIHDIVGVNSRLDAIHAGILTIKLTHLDEYIASRRNLASFYTNALNDIDAILTPQTMDYSSHVYHQYTLKILDGRRDEFQKFLLSHQIPSMIYYPKPLHQQPAYHTEYDDRISLANSEQLSQEVISLPMHTHMSDDQRNFIIEKIRKFFV